MSAPRSGPGRPRAAAVRVLGQVLAQGEPLDRAIEQVAHEVPPDSAAWFQDICSGVLRWKGRLDLAIDSVALKKKPTGWLRRALMVGAYQLIAQERTQAAPVVSETVSEIRSKEGDAPAKFANALLRKVADHAAEWRDLPFPGDRPIEEQAAWASLPPWMWQKLVHQRGLEWSCAFARATLQRPTLWLRSRAGWKAPEGFEPGPIPDSWRNAQGGNVTGLSGFGEGSWIVQDISSQRLVTEITAAATGGGSGAANAAGRTALDLCAAPGGKSVGLAWSGWTVTATDRAPRLPILRQSIERTASGVQVIEREAVSALPLQDLVWVDSPCSGSGILRRHPDARWVKKEADLRPLGTLQRELAQEGWERVKPGGYFAYTVCSVFKDEGSGLISGLKLPQAEVIREWLLSPQDEPFGDGFWGILIQKGR